MRQIISTIKLLAIVLWTIVYIMVGFVILLVTFFRVKVVLWIGRHIWATLILKILNSKLTVQGLENIDPNKNYIILANHTSNLDVPILNAGFPSAFYYVAKKEFKKIPLMGWMMAAVGTIFIDRSNREKGIRSIRMAGKKIKNGKSVLIFPEGTFDETEEMLPFKKGPFHLAIYANCEILPVAIVNATKVWPADTNFNLKSAKVGLNFGKPISTEGITEDDIQKLSDKTREAIENLLKMPILEQK